MKAQGFCHCDSGERLLYTSFLLLVGIGYLMALVYLYTNYQGIDGEPGLSVEDIAENYYGNRSGSRLEAALRGPMSKNIETEQRHVIMQWLSNGAPESAYQSTVRPIIEKQCLRCHQPASGLPIPDLSNYAEVQKVINIDTGVSLHSLMRVSHIHLFGIGLVLLGVGMIFRRVRMVSWQKSILVVLPFAAIFTDILTWFLTKWDPVYAYIIVGSGAMLGLSLATQIILSLYQLWFFDKEKCYV